MKREIKFRGKSLDNCEWCYGSLLIWEDGGCSIFEKSDSPDAVWKRDVDPETVGQYTGINDKNGTRIFEGDVLRMYDNKRYTFTCIYLQTQSAFLGKCNESQLRLANITEGVPKEIIGNIHDNPELLETK